MQIIILIIRENNNITCIEIIYRIAYLHINNKYIYHFSRFNQLLLYQQKWTINIFK